MKIAHFGDIHVRSMSRHDEYRKVFEAALTQLRRDPADHIFIAGDSFHTKTSGMSPECIQFMCWLFQSLADVAPLHIILGNHDGNLTNNARQDAITPIVEALKHPRVHLYKKSGVYEFEPGWNWCIFSLFDKEGWPAVAPVPGKINIACYHGGVRSSVTETGWAIEDGPSLDFFDGYDLVLLGDIHRAQFLGEPKSSEIVVSEEELALYPDHEVIEELEDA